MKFLLLIVLLELNATLSAQDLDNTEWIQIKLLEKNGNEIKISRKTLSLKLYFKGDSLFRSANEQYAYRDRYEITDNVLLVGKSTKFRIDSISNEMLIISDIPNVHLSDNNIHTHILLNTDYIFNFLRKENLLRIAKDSILQSDYYISPTFDGDFDKYFMSMFKFNVQNDELFCSFIIQPDGSVSNIQVKCNKQSPVKQTNRIKDIIASTKDRWIIPPVPNGYRLNLNFAANVSNELDRSGSFAGNQYTLTFHADSLNSKDLNGSKSSDVAKENENFNSGVRLMQKENYEKAIEKFKKCLEINPLDTDVLYDIANCYQKTGNIELACEGWKKLKESGEKDGEKLYNENCKTQNAPK